MSVQKSNEELTADQIVGATLYTKRLTNIYSHLGYASNASDANLIKEVPANTFLGTVTSYLVREGAVYWEIASSSPSLFGGKATIYVKHDKNYLRVDEDTIYHSPVDEEEESLKDTLVNTVIKIATIGAVAYGVVKVSSSLINKKPTNE